MTSPPSAPWWAADPGDAPPSPLGAPRLLGLASPRADLLLTGALLAVILVSRLAALPASPWEQDEAYFTCAVVRLDVAANHPHPPWFPLWISLGKALHALGVPPFPALQLLGLAAGTWILFPLTALWSLLLRRPLAAAASLLFLACPGPWLLAGRGFSGTAATAALVAALAWWLRPDLDRRIAALGSLAAAAAVLIRPHLLLPVGVTILWQLLRRPGLRLPLLLPVLAGTAAGAGYLLAAAGPVALRESLVEHGSYHFPLLGAATHGLGSSGLARSLLTPWAAVLWLCLAVVGFALLLRGRRGPLTRRLLGGALLPLVVVVWGLSDPAHARYAVPLLALTSGAVVAAVAAVASSRTAVWAAVGAAVASSAVTVGPWLPAYRTEISPPLEALRHAASLAAGRGAVLVVDRRLVAFVDLEQAVTGLEAPVLFDHLLEGGLVPPPPPEFAVAVLDAGDHPLLLEGRRRTFSCRIAPLRTLSQDRFMDVTVVQDPVFQDRSTGGPLVILD